MGARVVKSAEGLGAAVPAEKKPRRPRARRRRRSRPAWQGLALNGVEVAGWLAAALVGVMTALGALAERFGGTEVWTGLLPFCAGVLALVLAAALLLRLWMVARAWLWRRLPPLPALVAVGVGAVGVWFALQPEFRSGVVPLRRLMGGKVEAERVAIAHQVFAAYRRSDLGEMERLLDRARPYQAAVDEAAAEFGVDPGVLVGVAAAESSFRPRDSRDGGRGLFQITAVPAEATARARRKLGVSEVDLADPRHNAFVAAATLRLYIEQMRGDLFLGLLAYNMGPKNGGLLSVMQQYGARDFVTIQPYLQHLPRDYPIRVLSASLAFRVRRDAGRLLRYDEADSAQRIQEMGIPGFEFVRARGPARQGGASFPFLPD